MEDHLTCAPKKSCNNTLIVRRVRKKPSGTHIFKNPAQRSLAKLNSFWAKFGERLNTLVVTSVSSPQEYLYRLDDRVMYHDTDSVIRTR